MKHFNLTEIIKGNKLGYQAVLIALSKANWKAGTTISASPLIKPKKAVNNPSLDVLSLDDFRDLAQPEEFNQVQEVQQENIQNTFEVARDIMNSTITYAKDVLVNEPTNVWLCDVRTPLQRIIERSNYMRDNDSNAETHKNSLKALTAFDTEKGLTNLATTSKEKAQEMIRNSYAEFQSLDNMDSISTLASEELIDIICQYDSPEIMEKVEASILNLTSRYAKNPNFNLDAEFKTYGNQLQEEKNQAEKNLRASS